MLLRQSILFIALLSICFSCQQSEKAPETTTSSETAVSEVSSEPAAIAATPKLNIGDTAPDFNLTGIDGSSHSLANMPEETKGYIVTFTCNTCPYAVKYEDRLIDLHSKMAPLGYPVVAIQPNDVSIKPGDNMEAMIKRAADKGIEYHYLLDEKQAVYPAYGATRTPEIFLLDKDRTLLYHGAIDDDVEGTDVSVNYVSKAIEAHEAGTAIDPADVKAVGCSIKAK